MYVSYVHMKQPANGAARMENEMTHRPTIQITDQYGYITDRATREAYDRIISRNVLSGSERSAEAFLRLIERYAARGIRLIPARPTQSAP